MYKSIIDALLGRRDPKAKRPSFYVQLFQETVAMASYAMSSGMALSAALSAELSALQPQLRPRVVPRKTSGRGAPPAKANPARPSPSDKANPAPSTEPKPAPVPASAKAPKPGAEVANQSLDQQANRPILPPIKKLIELHIALTRVISPATPRSILLLVSEESSPWRFLGPVPLVRQMMLLALISLASFVLISLCPQINVDQINKSLLEHNGISLLLNELFLISAAAVGACFANLFEANRHCTNGTFDPRYNSSYWVRFVLGMIAGLILAEVISFEMLQGSAQAQIQPSETTTTTVSGLVASQPMVKPILAMLGGFSSDLVIRILRRIVTGVESMLNGDPREQIRSSQAAEREQAQMESDRERVLLASELADLKSKLGEGAEAEAASKQLDELLNRLTRSQPPQR